MRMSIVLGGACAALGLSLVAGAPTTAAAACSGATTGTIVGGVGGALVGNAISKGGGGAIIGGLGGAVIGHEIGKSGCRSTTYRSTRYYSSHRSRSAGYRYNRSSAPAYYDSYGRPVYSTGARYDSSGYNYGACRTETRAYYNERGDLVQRAVSVCDR